MFVVHVLKIHSELFRMKRILPVICAVLFFALYCSSAHSQTVVGSTQYLDTLSPAFEKIKVKTWDYLQAVAKGSDGRLVETNRERLLAEIEVAASEIRRVPAFNGSYELRDALLTYFMRSGQILREDYDNILDMEAIANQTYDAMEAYLLAKEKANEKLEEAYFDLIRAQKKFADENKIMLHRPDDDVMTQKIEKTGLLLSYYNKIYLIFFRVFKQESKVMAALQGDDLADFNWSNKILEFETNVALEKLQNQSAFYEDSTLLKAAAKSLEFYKREATVDAEITSKYYQTKKKFEETKAEFEKIPKENLVQADVDRMNEVGRTYNTVAGEFQKFNRVRHQERVQQLIDWNQQVEKFLNNHAF